MSGLAVRGEAAPLTRSELELVTDQIRMIKDTPQVPLSYRGDMQAIFAVWRQGRAVGIDLMEALQQIYVVNGKPCMSALLMVALARRQGHSIEGESEPGKVTLNGTRADNGDTWSVTWTLEDAKHVGLTKKENWKLYPDDMLWARAASSLCRKLFGDVLMGLAYTPEELEPSPEQPTVAALESLPVPGEPADVITLPEPDFGPDPEPEPEPEPATEPAAEPEVETTSAHEEAGGQSSFTPPPGAYDRE